MSRVPSASGIQLLRTDDFTGGLNLRANAFQLAGNESPDLLNVDIDPRGGFAMRAGSNTLHTDDIGVDPPHGASFSMASQNLIRLFVHQKGQPKLMAATSSRVITHDGYLGDNFYLVREFPVESWFGPAMAEYQKPSYSDETLYVTHVEADDVDSPFLWDGSVTSDLIPSGWSGAGDWQNDLSTPTGTHIPLAEHVVSHVDRLWVASTKEDGVYYESRLRFSHPLFPESWREEDYIDVIEGGRRITGIAPFNGNLVVFKERAVFLLTGYSTDTFQLIPISTRHGCVNPMAFTELDGRLYFYDADMGLFMFDGTQIVNLFDRLAPAFVTEGDFTNSGDDYIFYTFDGVRVWGANRRVWVSDVNEGTTYVFDPSIGRRYDSTTSIRIGEGAWTRFAFADGSPTGHGCEYNGNTVYIHPANKRVLYADPAKAVDTWDGVDHSFESYYVTRWQDAGYVSVKKRWRRSDLIVQQTGDAQTLDVKVYCDWQEGKVCRSFTVNIAGAPNETALEWGVGEWGVNSWGATIEGAQYVRTSQLGPARSVQLKIAGPGGQRWGINSITYKYNLRRLKA